MRRSFVMLSLLALAGLAADIRSAPAAENPALCFAIAQNYNNCLRAQQRPRQWGGGGGGHLDGYYGGGHDGYHGGHPEGYDDDRGYRRGGWGGEYGHGHGGGYDGYDDEYRQYRRAARRQRAQARCAAWLAQMQASGCM